LPKTLYIVEDDVLTGLPELVRNTALAETSKVLTFIPNFQVKKLQPSQFPAALDFTDSVVRLGADDADVQAYFNAKSNQQQKNVKASATQKGIKVTSSLLGTYTPGTPDTIGVGFMWKEVKPAGDDKKLAITQTGGIVSLKSIQEVVVQSRAHGREKSEILQSQKDEQRRLGDKYHGSAKEKQNDEDLKQYDLLNKPLKDWPDDVQKKVGVVLGRALAHEARHQYFGPEHAKTGGIGADAPDLPDDKNYGSFSDDDKKEINNKIAALEQNQSTATVQIETNPKGEPFPF
jgi:hypothetical protein